MSKSKITLVWVDGREEEVTCFDWHWNLDGILVICVNDVTRQYRYIVKEQIREVRTK